MDTFDFENITDPLEAERVYGKGNRLIENELVVLLKSRTPNASAVISQIETLRGQNSERVAAWENYKQGPLADWVKNWSKTQQDMNDRDSKLDHAILKALQKVQELCFQRADAAHTRRVSELKYAEVGGVDHNERMFLMGKDTRVMGKTVHAGQLAEQIVLEVFTIFTDFAKANPDLETFLTESEHG